MLNNTTNIPDQLVAHALAFIMEDEDMRDIELPLRLTVKNKRHGKVHGQWGWYYSAERRIVLIVPRVIRKPFLVKRKYAPIASYHCFSRSDFLVGVLAHEMRHCYQFQSWNTPRSSWRLKYDELGKIARETDAQLFEGKMIRLWQATISNLRKELMIETLTR